MLRLPCLHTRLPSWGNYLEATFFNLSGFPKNLGDFLKNLGDFPKNLGDFPKNLGGFPINLGAFPKNLGAFPKSKSASVHINCNSISIRELPFQYGQGQGISQQSLY